MKPARIPHTITAPEHWSSMPWGEYYRESLERHMKPWLAKLYGFHLLKIGNLSAEINTEACAISHQVNVSLGEVRSRSKLTRCIFLSPPNLWMPVYWRILCHGAAIRTGCCGKLTAC